MRSLLQFTLDLFDSGLGDDPLPVPETVAPSHPKPRPRPGPGPSSDAPRATVPGAALPSAGLAPPEGDAPAYRHPRANREARLGEARIAYEFIRGKRRTIGFVVGADGLSVRAPRWVALRDVDAALQEKAGWILRKLEETRARHERLEATRIVWQDGAELPFLGRPLVLRLDAGAMSDAAGPGAVLEDAGGPGAPSSLRVGLPRDAEAARVRQTVEAWLKRQARRVFTERLAHYAPRLGVQWTAMTLSNAATRWGSASADGRIRLNWRLIHLRLPLIDYVVAHELAHLRVMDHSPRFWATLATVVPDHEALRRQLRDDAVPRG
ncbi:MAG: M48 family peptidase [Comamonadaceae bacterium]|nr:MAG: M48 family peptidase [Comamonadaceae bacterium]